MTIDVLGYRVDFLTGVSDCTDTQNVTYTSQIFVDVEPMHARKQALDYATSLQPALNDVSLLSHVSDIGVELNNICYAISVYLFTTDADLHLIYIDSNFEVILKGSTEKVIAGNLARELKIYKDNVYQYSDEMLVINEEITPVNTVGNHFTIGAGMTSKMSVI